MGYNPYKDQVEMFVKKQPNPRTSNSQMGSTSSTAEIIQLATIPSECWKYSERVGCSNSMLKTVLIIFLSKHQPELVDTIDPHSLSTRKFLENVSYHINTTGEKTRALQALKKFQRPVGQSFLML